jgi:hypothetical protein
MQVLKRKLLRLRLPNSFLESDMKTFRNLVIAMIFSATTVVSGCKEDEQQNQPAALPAASKPQPAAEHKDDHDHDGGVHGGPKHDLGNQKVGDLTIAVKQVGEVTAGKEGTFEITVTGASKPKAIRAWVGVNTGEGSTKVKARETHEFFDADLEVPDPLPANSKLWIELELANETKTISFDLKK